MPFSFLGSPPPPVKVSSEPTAQATPNSVPAVPQLPSSDAFAAVAQLFQTTQGQQVNCLLKGEIVCRTRYCCHFLFSVLH